MSINATYLFARSPTILGVKIIVVFVMHFSKKLLLIPPSYTQISFSALYSWKPQFMLFPLYDT